MASPEIVIKFNRMIPHRPTARQAAFLAFMGREALYGGAAGGGKSDALLMSALQYADRPNYAAILFRRTYPELSMPGGLMDRAHDWLATSGARWRETDKRWDFPGGASLNFAYAEALRDVYRYQGTEFDFIGWDQVEQHKEPVYRYMFSRNRHEKSSNIPSRIRSTANPGGLGFEWVKRRFIDADPSEDMIFIPAKLQDNPYIDQADYIKSLMHLDPITRAQLLNGDWTARTEGGKFKREWFKIVDAPPASKQWVRYWDLAATEAEPGSDPDWTAGCLMCVSEGVYYICDMRHIRGTPNTVERLILQTAKIDGKNVDIYIEQEPGSSGVKVIADYVRLLAGYTMRGDKKQGGDGKEIRANPLSSQAEAGNVRIVNGTWISEFLDELEAFPHGGHDDMVDAASGAFHMLSGSQDGYFRYISNRYDAMKAKEKEDAQRR